eukprot:TRINITY_DN4354_c0_g1_i1.p1 TRINITY_DN4354_c0_g1~~TRINITY_DN4354_c0_g1_i1.p1  ORF type:complete len:505 (-),score=115.35 TRINITY_DN4354_c0_g1_i1:237-1751(-)
MCSVRVVARPLTVGMLAFAAASLTALRSPPSPSAPRTSSPPPQRPRRAHPSRPSRTRRASSYHRSQAAPNHSVSHHPRISAFLPTPRAPPPPPAVRPSRAPSPPECLPQPLTLRAVNVRLKALVRRKHEFHRCVWLYQQLMLHRITPDKYTYSLLLTACATTGRTRHAMQLFHQLRHHRIPLDNYLRANLLTVVARSKQPDIAFAMWVFASSPKPSTLLCNILIELFARTRNLTGAECVHRYMNAAQIRVDAYTVSALIRAHVATGGPHAALSALRDMWRAGLSVHAAAFGQVIAAFGEQGLIDEAVALFDEMTVFGVQPLQTTFNVLIAACVGRDVRKAFEIFDEMNASTSFGGDRYTYHALIKCCLAAREAHRVAELYDAIKRSGFQPNQVSYRLTLVAAGMMMDGDLVERVARDMSDNGCEARMDTAATLVAAAIRCSDLQAALQHFSSFVSGGDAARNARFFDEIRAALRAFDARDGRGVQDWKHTQLVVDELQRSCTRE